MKKFLFIRTAVLSASLFSLCSVQSQSFTADKLASLDYNKRPASPAPATTDESADRAILTDMKAQNTKLFNNFSAHFKNATNIKVSPEKGETHISCYVNGVLHKIDYTKKGSWLYTIRYYEGSKLPREVGNIVNGAYPNYSIFGFVAEVSVPGNTAYLVMIENQDSWKRVRVVDNSIDTYEEYNKP